MAVIVRPHTYSDGAVARPDQANLNETTLYNLVNGNIDWGNIKAALQNAANGLVKLDANGDVPLPQIPESLKSQVPAGVIVMWSGTLATIPAGWSLCDGTGETPDLRGKFIYGWTDGVDPGGSGGAATHTHTVGTHTHGVGTLAVASAGAHQHQLPLGNPPGVYVVTQGIFGTGASSLTYGCGAGCGDKGSFNLLLSESKGAHIHTLSGSSAAGGVANTGAGSTLPPYYKLAFIQKD